MTGKATEQPSQRCWRAVSTNHHYQGRGSRDKYYDDKYPHPAKQDLKDHT
jgi:hypothetical protein